MRIYVRGHCHQYCTVMPFWARLRSWVLLLEFSLRSYSFMCWMLISGFSFRVCCVFPVLCNLRLLFACHLRRVPYFPVRSIWDMPSALLCLRAIHAACTITSNVDTTTFSVFLPIRRWISRAHLHQRMFDLAASRPLLPLHTKVLLSLHLRSQSCHAQRNFDKVGKKWPPQPTEEDGLPQAQPCPGQDSLLPGLWRVRLHPRRKV